MIKGIYNKVVLFDFQRFAITYYGLYFALGITLQMALILFAFQSLSLGLDKSGAWILTYLLAFGFAFGTKMLRLFYSRKEFFQDPVQVLKRNGNSFFGGVFGMIFASFIFCQIHPQMHFAQALDLVFWSLPVFQIFIRLGCASYGCCHGTPHEGRWSILYTDERSPGFQALGGRRAHATQSYSVVKNILLFLIVSISFFAIPREGVVLIAWLMGYSTLRFIVDLTRFKKSATARGLRKSQKISIFMFSIGLALLLFQHFASHSLESIFISPNFRFSIVEWLVILLPIFLLNLVIYGYSTQVQQRTQQQAGTLVGVYKSNRI